MKALRLLVRRLQPVLLAASAGTLLTMPVRAGHEIAGPGEPLANGEAAAAAAPVGSGFDLSGEYDVSDAYVGDAGVRRDGRTSSLDEYDSQARFVLTPLTGLGYLRLGAEWERYSFGYPDGAPLPNTLQTVSLIVGLDTKFSDSILVRIEAQPGIHGTSFRRLNTGNFMVPFVVGGTYIFSPDLQVIAGVGVQFDRKYPAIPGLGVRWKFAPHLVLNAVLPTPRVEYEFSRALTLYAGAEFKDETFRLDRHFGATHGQDSSLNHSLLNYSEIRAGGGLSWKVGHSMTVTGEGGCQPYREFDFYRADARYRPDGVAPYGVISVHGEF